MVVARAGTAATAVIGWLAAIGMATVSGDAAPGWVDVWPIMAAFLRAKFAMARILLGTGDARIV